MQHPMEFWIADTFSDSLAKLAGQEQKAIKTTAFDLQLDRAIPGALRPGALDIDGPRDSP